MAQTLDPTTVAPAARSLPTGWIVGGVIALLAVGGGAYFAGRQSPAAPVEAAAVEPAGKAVHNAKAPAERSDRVESAAPACADCGVVESVTAVKRKGEGSGVGAVAGTVVGGAVGNQFGKGDGRTAMTVLGAIGGAVAGHEVEKQVKAKTVYVVKVRTEGGELRTVEQATAPAVGARVKVEGKTLRPLQG
ncbi:glycine zipper 2TM domain-containing protein [Leptothrix sp. BB-4]